MFLSKAERDYLSGSREFINKQKRDMKYRLNKKLRLLNSDIAAISNFRGPAELHDASAAGQRSSLVRIPYSGVVGNIEREEKTSGPNSYTLIVDWQQFHQFLLQRMTPNTAADRIRYAKQFGEKI